MGCGCIGGHGDKTEIIGAWAGTHALSIPNPGQAPHLCSSTSHVHQPQSKLKKNWAGTYRLANFQNNIGGHATEAEQYLTLTLLGSLKLVRLPISK